MRMWMVPPRKMCRKHLLGEHVEIHMAVATLRLGKSVAGFLEKGQTVSRNEAPKLPTLTAREREITQLLAEGNSSKEVASLLNLSTKTVETHRSNIMRKLSFHSIRDLVVYAIKNNLIQIELPPPPKTPAGPTAA